MVRHRRSQQLERSTRTDHDRGSVTPQRSSLEHGSLLSIQHEPVSRTESESGCNTTSSAPLSQTTRVPWKCSFQRQNCQKSSQNKASINLATLHHLRVSHARPTHAEPGTVGSIRPSRRIQPCTNNTRLGRWPHDARFSWKRNDDMRERQLAIGPCYLTRMPTRRTGRAREDAIRCCPCACWSAKQSHHGEPPPVCC
jgi:hypothetical protein